ncbi:MAG: DUF72 domain-containing protein [Desulfuromonadales bacterium]|nr:DUF72 domain-containing protein [Desulfuromonadales bacterium]
MKGEVRIGTSGWTYPHWRGVYYPEGLAQKDWFGHYLRDFDTVEINNTFYRLPSPQTFEHWARVAPPGFVYSFKASRFITHLKKLKDPRDSLHNFLERAHLAGAALGPILFQLPPHWKLDLLRLETFLQALPPDLVRVFEFRDESWHRPEVRDLLSRYRAAFCIHDYQGLACPDWTTAATVYLRFHGSAAAPYSGSYSDDQLRRQAERILAWRQEGRSLFAYFNNDLGGYAVRNALTLKQLLANSLS